MSDVLNVEPREGRGTTASRRLRAKGKIPAVLYGHGEATVSLVLNAKSLGKVLRHGGQVVQLAGSVNENALIKDLQYDTFGSEVLHVDLMRVAADERIEVTVQVELKGDAPGVAAGGIVEQPSHELEISCLATSVPEKLVLSIESLQIGESLHASDVALPQGAKLVSSEDTVVAHCIQPDSGEPAAGEGEEASEPEVIGGKPDGESGDAGE